MGTADFSDQIQSTFKTFLPKNHIQSLFMTLEKAFLIYKACQDLQKFFAYLVYY